MIPTDTPWSGLEAGKVDTRRVSASARWNWFWAVMPRADVADRSPRHVSLPGVHHFTLADGQIAATADFWDKDAFLAQIR